jgi:hypothetical protein
MKRILYLGFVVGSACQPPNCPEGERKIGKTCYDIPSVAADAGPPTSEDAAIGQDATQSLGNGEAAQRNDATVPRDVEPGSVDPRSDAGASDAEDAEDAGARKDGADASSPPSGGADASSPLSTDASAEDASIRDAAPDASTCQPSAEVCNGKDDDCDGAIDESPPTWYPDCDLDGVASVVNTVASCVQPFMPACTSWTDVRPAVPDCNDLDPRYSPNAPVFASTNGPNAEEEKFYLGDMNCDGVVTKPTAWEYWDDFQSKWVSTSMPLCSDPGSCSNLVDCYANTEQAAMPIGCGNTEITINVGGVCSFHAATARVRCQ